MSSQEKMGEYIEKTLYENNIEQKDSINGLMKSQIEVYSFEEQFMTFRFPMMPWQVNRAGFLQGGLVAVAFDMVVSAVARFFTETHYIPTVSLDINYLKPVNIGDDLLVTAKVISLGKRISHYTLEGKSAKTGKIVATGSAIYLKAQPEATKKENSTGGNLRQILNDSDRR